MHTSDIAYVVMQRVNNKTVWKAEWDQKNKGGVWVCNIGTGETGKKKAHKIGQKKPRVNQRGRSARERDRLGRKVKRKRGW